ESGAFVYGAMSFTDKISNGIAVLLIENCREALTGQPVADGEVVRMAYCVLPAVSVLLGAATLYWMKYGSKTLVEKAVVHVSKLDKVDAGEKRSLLQNDTVYGAA
ncbi:hypothetical protein As57867_023290, partial [Aphanomyces stellatus]